MVQKLKQFHLKNFLSNFYIKFFKKLMKYKKNISHHINVISYN